MGGQTTNSEMKEGRREERREESYLSFFKIQEFSSKNLEVPENSLSFRWDLVIFVVIVGQI